MYGHVRISISVTFSDDSIDKKRSYAQKREFHSQGELYATLESMFHLLQEKIQNDFPEEKMKQTKLDQHLKGEKIE